MRLHDPEKYLYDAREAARRIERFTRGKSFADYVSDDLLRSGVERQLIIIGEAINNLSRISPGLAGKISGYQEIIAFRNVVVHGYDIVENETVWGTIRTHLPTLQRELDALLAKKGNPE